MAAWPRNITPATVTPLEWPGALQSKGQTGRPQRRSTLQIGVHWTETFPVFDAESDVGKELLAAVNFYWRGGTSFDIEHYHHTIHNGGGSGASLVNGASQTGGSLVTDTWSGSNPVLKAGQIFRVAGLANIFQLTANAPNLSGGGTSLAINPPIFTGGSPANNAALTYTNVRINAYLADVQGLGSSDASKLIGGLVLSFEEAI